MGRLLEFSKLLLRELGLTERRTFGQQNIPVDAKKIHRPEDAVVLARFVTINYEVLGATHDLPMTV